MEPPNGKVYTLALQKYGLYYVMASCDKISVNESPFHQSQTKVHTSVATHRPSLELCHQRLAHLNKTSLKALIPTTSFELNETELSSVCEVCVKSKHTRKFERKPAPRTSRPFELLHSDLCGPITPASHSSSRYFILYIDDYT